MKFRIIWLGTLIAIFAISCDSGRAIQSNPLAYVH